MTLLAVPLGAVSEQGANVRKILIVKAHPREESFCNELVDRYVAGANTNDAVTEVLSLRDLELEPWLKYGWDRNHDSIPASEGVERAQGLIAWSEHLLFAYPTYWALPPALLTLFIDVVVTSGFAFKYHKPILGKIPRWDRLLEGRTATIMSTMDSPPVFMDLHDRDPGGKMMRDVLRFTGVKLKRRHYFGSVVLSDDEKRSEWLTTAYDIGVKDSR